MKQTAHTTHRSWLRRPLVQIVLSRLREFYREPEAVFWVYGFPLLMVVALGIAFRNQPDRPIAVDVVEGEAGASGRSGARRPTSAFRSASIRSKLAGSGCVWERPIWS